MPKYRIQVSVPVDTALPRDRMVINPTFDDKGALTNPANLCQDLAAATQTYFGGGFEVKCVAYDIEDLPPSPPKGQGIVAKDAKLDSSSPREIALCLSFYAGDNVKRKRGRLYIPQTWLNKKANLGTAQRPTAQQMTNAGGYATILAQLGGADVDWVVWSKTDGVARKVSNWYVDDEWDIQRRRGSKPTSRTIGTTSG